MFSFKRKSKVNEVKENPVKSYPHHDPAIALKFFLDDHPNQLKNLTYLSSYSEYNEILNTLQSFRVFLEKTENPPPLIITVETNERTENVRETMLLELINTIFTEAIIDGESSYIRYEKSVGASEFKIGSLLKDYDEPTIFEFEYVEKFLKDTEDEIKFLELIEGILNNHSIILRGTKKSIRKILNAIDRKAHMNFDMTNEISIEEAVNILRDKLKYRNLEFNKEVREGLIQLLEYSKEPITTTKVMNLKDELFALALHSGNATLDFEKIKQSKQLVINNSIEELEVMIGLRRIKDTVQSLVDYLEFNKQLEKEKGASIDINLNMMFYGSPGTGKTTVARIIAKILFELGYLKKNLFIEVDAKDLVSKWVGDSSLKANSVIQEATGGMLFVDEAYALKQNEHGKESIATLIKAMSDLGSDLVVVYAGYKDEMEDFLSTNPGIRSRIAYHMEFEDYSTEELLSIFNKLLSEYKMTASAEFIQLTKSIFEEYKQKRDFGNGRFVVNYLQKCIITHASFVKKNNVSNKFELVASSIPNEYKR